MATGLTLRSATWLSDELAAGRLSASEVVTAHIDHVVEHDEPINSIVQVAREQALVRARELDVGDAPPVQSSLRGLPFTVKDNFETEGLVTAIGVPQRREVIPKKDAALVARMKSRGAILLAKTNCPPWGVGPNRSDNPVYGRTNNPYDLSRTPGGSSGGAAAAVAAGMSPIGFGTDSGGSVRVPAHYCGVAAIVPTRSSLPISGVIDDDGRVGPISDPRTRVGVFARAVDDLVLVLRELTGSLAHDDAVPVRIADPHQIDISALRVALEEDDPAVRLDDASAKTLDRAAGSLAKAGARVRSGRLPRGGHDLTRAIWRSYGENMTTDELYRILREWDEYRRRMADVFTTFDVIMSPVAPTPAPPHDAHDDMNQFSHTAPYSLTDCPCAVVRCGGSPAGLPIGVQVVGAPWRDHVALAVAAFLETEFGGWIAPSLAPAARPAGER